MKTLQSVRGFTFIEVLVTIIILSLGIIAVATLQGKNAANNAKSQVLSTITMIAESELEKIVHRPYAQCVHEEKTIVVNGESYATTCRVFENATGNCKEICLIVEARGMNATFHYIKTKHYE